MSLCILSVMLTQKDVPCSTILWKRHWKPSSVKKSEQVAFWLPTCIRYESLDLMGMMATTVYDWMNWDDNFSLIGYTTTWNKAYLMVSSVSHWMKIMTTTVFDWRGATASVIWDLCPTVNIHQCFFVFFTSIHLNLMCYVERNHSVQYGPCFQCCFLLVGWFCLAWWLVWEYTPACWAVHCVSVLAREYCKATSYHLLGAMFILISMSWLRASTPKNKEICQS